MPLYNHLKEYRAKIDVNQYEMGKLVGVSRQTISQIERGDYSPSVTLALKIAKVFDVPVEAIFEYVEDTEDDRKKSKDQLVRRKTLERAEGIWRNGSCRRI